MQGDFTFPRNQRGRSTLPSRGRGPTRVVSAGGSVSAADVGRHLLRRGRRRRRSVRRLVMARWPRDEPESSVASETCCRWSLKHSSQWNQESFRYQHNVSTSVYWWLNVASPPHSWIGHTSILQFVLRNYETYRVQVQLGPTYASQRCIHVYTRIRRYVAVSPAPQGGVRPLMVLLYRYRLSNSWNVW